MAKDDNENINERVSPSYLADENEDRDIDFRHYLLAIINRRWMIITLTVITVVAAAVYSFFQTPVYRARAVVDLSPPNLYIILPDSASQSMFVRNEAFTNTQVRLLKGKTLALNVVRKLGITAGDIKVSKRELDAKSEDDAIKEIANRLLKMITVTPVQETSLCDIAFVTPDPRLSMRLANAWAEEYVASRMDSMQQYTRTAEQLLMEQVKSLQQEIGDKEKALHDLSFQKKIIKVDKNHSMVSEKLQQVNGALTEASRSRIDAQIRYQAVRSTSRDSIPEVLHHPLVIQKKNEFAALQRQYSDKSKIYKGDYPEMVRLHDQMEQVNKELTQAYEDAYQEVLATARGEYQEASIKEGTLKSQMNQALQDNAQSSREELDYDQIQMEIDNKKGLLAMLLQKQNQTDVSAQMQEKAVPASRIIEYAEVPKFIYSPNITRIMLLSLLVGFGGSIGFALLLEHFDRSLRTPEDVEQQLHLPFLGMVPHYALDGGNGHHHSSKPKEIAPVTNNGDEKAVDRYVPYRLSVSDLGSSASEALKTVRTSFLLAFPGSPPRSVLITSSRAGEGKTFISCNLAVALTQLNKRVILIDADMRNPHIHKVWNIPNDRGLSIFLTSDVPIASMMQPSPVPTLSLMASGPKTPRPAELLASERFGDLLRELESSYDFVIVDSPPILPVTDSVILASRVQSVLMVVRGGVTPRDVVKMAKKKLSSSNGVIAGTVLNGIDMADPYYYYRYYSDYYSDYYGPTEKHPNNNGNNHNNGT